MTEKELERSVKSLERYLDKFTIMGPNVSGSFKRGFVVGADIGGGGGVGDSPPRPEGNDLTSRIAAIEHDFRQFTIRGDAVRVQGSFRTGFAMNILSGGQGGVGGGSVGPIPPPPPPPPPPPTVFAILMESGGFILTESSGHIILE